jgi:hypothetical protein
MFHEIRVSHAEATTWRTEIQGHKNEGNGQKYKLQTRIEMFLIWDVLWHSKILDYSKTTSYRIHIA